jgi:hypothetical protein
MFGNGYDLPSPIGGPSLGDDLKHLDVRDAKINYFAAIKESMMNRSIHNQNVKELQSYNEDLPLQEKYEKCHHTLDD